MSAQQKSKESLGYLHTITVPSKFWPQVIMDIVGPLPKSSHGNNIKLVRDFDALTDYFTKWAEASALPNKSAEEVASFM